MGHDVFIAVLIMLLISLPLAALAVRLRLGALTGYLVAGALAGALAQHQGWANAVTTGHLQPLAEIGAALLLFTLGLELDLGALRRNIRPVLIGGGGQIVLTLLAGTGIGLAIGLPLGHGVAIGACLSMSSTIFLLRALDERRLRNRSEGQICLGITLLQDLALAPLLVLIALFIPQQETRPLGVIAAAAGVLLAATWVIRKMLASRLIMNLRGLHVPEIEITFAVTVALGSAWLSEHWGLGAASGAFCAGLALGGAEHRRHLAHLVAPLQGLFAVIFFGAMGVLFQPAFVMDHALQVAVALIASLGLKVLIGGLTLRLAGWPVRSAIGGGLMLGNIGEFSFVLAATAFADSADPAIKDLGSLMVAITCLSLALTPLLMTLASRFLPTTTLDRITESGESVVVAGLGPVGHATVEALRSRGCPLLLVDRNAALLEPWRNVPGVRVHLGKIEDMEDWLPVLGHRPALVVLTYPIADASAIAARRLLALDPDLPIIARAAYTGEIPILTRAGVRHVICDEQETARALMPLVAEALRQRDADANDLPKSPAVG